MANFDSESPIFISGAAAPKAWDVIDMRTNEYKPPLLNGEQDLCKRRERTKQPMKLGTPLRKNMQCMHLKSVERVTQKVNIHQSPSQLVNHSFIQSRQICACCAKKGGSTGRVACLLSLLSIVPTQPITVSLFEPRLWREREGRLADCCSLHPLYCR